MAKHMAPTSTSGNNAEKSADATVTAAPLGAAPAATPGPAATTAAPDSAAAPRHSAPAGKNRKRSNVLSNLLIVVGLALLIVAAVIYFHNEENYQKIDESNERVAEYARLSSDSGEPPVVDWESLKAINPDIVGWLQVPGTVVNYPVFQSSNNDYYLNHGPDRGDSIGGSVFLDYENTAPGLVDAQSIVYGHHMRNGSQFKQIADMDNQELFDGVDTVWYVTEQGAFELAPLFVYYTNEGDTNVRQFDFPDEAAFRAYLNEYLSRAVAKRPDAEQAVRTVRRVFTLSTCNYYDGYGRTLLVCGLKNEIPGTPQFEAAQVAAAQAAVDQAAAQAAPDPADQADEAAQAAQAAPDQPQG